MSILNLLSGNGLFLILALALIVIYVVNRIKKR